jgi:glutathione S-transferase
MDDTVGNHGCGEATIAARSATPDAQLLLFSSWFCPYAQRSWAHLEELVELGVVTYKWVEVDPYASPDSKQPLSLDAKRSKYPGFVDASPRGLVPAINHLGFCVNDSQVICEYLCDAFQGSLLPADVHDIKAKAEVRMFWEHVNSQVLPFFYKLLMTKDAAQTEEGRRSGRQEAADMLLAGLRVANTMMCASSDDGSFLGGSRYSLADLALAPWWYRFPSVLRTYRGFEVPETPDYQRLHNWWSKVKEWPAFKRTLVSPDRLIHNYKEYADGTANSEVARTLQ